MQVTTAFYQYAVSPSNVTAAKLAGYTVGLRPPLPPLAHNVFYPGTNVVSWMSQQAVSFLVRFQVGASRSPCSAAILLHFPPPPSFSLPL